MSFKNLKFSNYNKITDSFKGDSKYQKNLKNWEFCENFDRFFGYIIVLLSKLKDTSYFNLPIIWEWWYGS